MILVWLDFFLLSLSHTGIFEVLKTVVVNVTDFNRFWLINFPPKLLLLAALETFYIAI